MIIKQLQLIHFGKFHEKIIELRPGINIIYGGNEAGKTTVYRFIKAMFFGVTRLRGKAAANDAYTRMLPWETGQGYEGLMVIEHEGINYRLYRNFYKESPTFKVFNDDTGEEIFLSEGQIHQLIPGLTAANFSNTIAIGQQESAIDSDFPQKLQSYIANMSMTGHEAVDISQALALLKSEEKKIKKQMPEDKIGQLQQNIQRLEKQESLRQNYMNAIESAKVQERKLTKSIDQYEKRIEAISSDENTKQITNLRLWEKSFRNFLFFIIAALVLVVIQLVMPLNHVVFKVLTALLIVGAVIFLVKMFIEKKRPKGAEENQEEKLFKAFNQCQQELNKVVILKEKYTWELERLDKELEEKEELVAQLEQAKGTQKQLSKEQEGILIATEIIGQLTGAIHNQFGKRLNQQVAQVFGEIKGNQNQNMIIDEKLNIQIDGVKQLIPLDRMSTASIDQIYFALRFCAADLIFQGQEMPMILDDCFAYYDDQRLEQLLKWLTNKQRPQVILFTCHHREAETLDTIGEDYNYIHL